MLILGLNAYHADAAAVLLKDGVPVLAAEESRFTRVKHTAGFPEFAVRACLKAAGAKLSDLDHIAVAHDPEANLEEDVYYILTGRPGHSAMVRARLASVAKHRDVAEELSNRLDLPREQIRAEIHTIEHPLAHCAGAYFGSGVPEAALLSAGVFGDFCSTLTAAARGIDVVQLEKALFPHSIGVFMTAIAQYLGFGRYGEEGKVMGLAAYGTPKFADAMRRMIQPHDRDLVRLDTTYFTHAQQGVEMVWEDLRPHLAQLWSFELADLLGPPRSDGAPIEDRHRDLAASAVAVLSDLLVEIATQLHGQVPSDTLCYTGTVALNALANAELARRGPFKRLIIPPAPGDAGAAVGAAYLTHARVTDTKPPALPGPFLGPAFEEHEIETAVRRSGLPVETVDDPAAAAVELLTAGNVVGWFQGAMEWGPRALGNRSILADPRSADVREKVNTRVKLRAAFRPYACAMTAEAAPEWLSESPDSPYLSYVLPVQESKRDAIPAVVHHDGTVRVQTVTAEANPLFHDLLTKFGAATGVPVLLNTSFNKDEPIVCSPDDALNCFRQTRLDACIIGNRVVSRG
ncbi:MAG: carbamoyltransferase family protein [Planctomycetota bacterium]|jgi:carbamoyltransferase